MKKVPKMLSTKDSSYINDIFNWNITLYKKIENELIDCNDKDLSNILEEASEIHLSNCNILINYLKGCNK